jgi:importin subunit alpha-1
MEGVTRHEQYKDTGANAVERGRKDRHETSIKIRKEAKDRETKLRRNQVEPEVKSEKMRERLAMLPKWAEGVMSNDFVLAYESTEAIRKLISIEKGPPIEEVIATGIVPRLIMFLQQTESEALQFEAAWALTNIAAGTSNHTRTVVEAGAIPIFTNLLNSSNPNVREQAIWALGNISGDMVPYRDMVLQAGAMPLLLRLLCDPKTRDLSTIRNGTWTLSNFCRGKPLIPLYVVEPALPVLRELIEMSEEDILIDACWALSYISDGTQEKIQAIIASGVCERLVQLLSFPDENVQIPALRTVGNIVTGTDVQTQVMLNHGILPCLLKLMGSSRMAIVRETCWSLSNITAGAPEQIQAVIDAGFIPGLIQLLSSKSFDVKKEAAWALSNATVMGLPEQIRFLVNQDCIQPLCDLLDERDANLVIIALDALENILRVGQKEGMNKYAVLIDEAGGIDGFEDLTTHAQAEINQRAAHIIDQYFGSNDDVVAVVAYDF